MAQLDTISLFALAGGLAMDAFAVAISLGGTIRNLRPSQTLRLALAFGGFQGLMPVVGYLAGRTVTENPWVAAWDHWIAFSLLAFLGSKMIYEAKFLGEDEEETFEGPDPTKSVTLVILAIATSIDALAVGASLAFLRVTILMPSLVIGLTAALFAVIGARLGQRVGQRLGKRVEILGGLALIAIGFRILIDHLKNPTPVSQSLNSYLSLVGLA
ncbi:putative manganese efflux pump MntP [compost metagenome]